MIPQGPPEGDHMANGRVALAEREVKRQCRTLRISVEQNTSARMADDSPLLSWLHPFCSPRHEQRENRLRWKNERTETNWTKMVQANGTRGEKVWFRKVGEDGASSFAGRMTQGIFVGHPDQEGAVLCITKNGVVRGEKWT